MTAREIALGLGYELDDDQIITNISTSSKEIDDETIFVAIIGERFDGHKFVGEAIQKGAKYAVVSSYSEDAPKEKQLLVSDTKQAMIDIASVYRSKFDVKLIGVTGSVGKTTTKEMIACVLNSKYETLKNEGNFNNEIGMPKTIFKLTPKHEMAVVEMGMCGFGEIEALSLAARPAIGVITNIGVSHIERLGSRNNILKAKLEILKGMEKGSPIVYCGDNDLLDSCDFDGYTAYSYGIDNIKSTVYAEHINQIDGETFFKIVMGEESYNAKIPAIGKHNVLDAVCAFLVGVLCGVAPEDAADALSMYKPSGMRQNIVNFHGYKIIEDCYNASPDSMHAAIKAYNQMEVSGKKYLVLSDMLELGENAEEKHEEVGSFARAHGNFILLATGEMGERYVEGFGDEEKAHYFKTKDQLFDYILDNIKKGDSLWFKASRNSRLEDVILRIYRSVSL